MTRVNPLTPMGLLLLLGAVVSFMLDGGALLGLHAWLLLVLVLGLRVRAGELVRAHLLFAPFAIGVVMTNAVSRGGAVIAEVGPFEVTDDGLRVGLALALRVMVVAVPAALVARRTDPTRLVVAMMQHLRVRPRAGFAVLTAHRMLAEMPQRWGLLLAAGRSRAPLDRRGRPRLGAAGYGRAVMGLLVGGIRRGNRTADALDVRGIGAPTRTMRLQEPFSRLDVAAAALVTAGAVTAALAVSAAVGHL
ncbi:energy-coupling factor transporter transmembrane component T family protein [Pseudactinotalea terrae]|uniref:energy-coupling factor transporter transmembrane component T family protein n=1 Tax=Pseudactinotalea terrae TaxID=1743262 RepID=UPI0012E15155|nr:energy-coupling factor transporter transmembrane component T [Pseudactinotalea terrae]